MLITFEADKAFELVAINPSSVFGPLILPRTSTSHGVIGQGNLLLF